MAFYEAQLELQRTGERYSLYYGRDSAMAEDVASRTAMDNHLPMPNTEALYGLDVADAEIRVSVVIHEEVPGPHFWDWQQIVYGKRR